MSEEIGPEVRELFGLGFPAAERFAELLEEQGELRGLIGPREIDRIWSRHIVNSACVAPFLPPRGRVADVGSGAGFPGIVLAIMRPDLEFHLIESMEKRIAWLEEVKEELGLDNIVLHCKRAEDLHKKERFEAVTARAVANMTKLVRSCGPLIRGGGELLALKGRKAAEEVESAKCVLRKAGFDDVTINDVISVIDEELTTVVVAHKKNR